MQIINGSAPAELITVKKPLLQFEVACGVLLFDVWEPGHITDKPTTVDNNAIIAKTVAEKKTNCQEKNLRHSGTYKYNSIVDI